MPVTVIIAVVEGAALLLAGAVIVFMRGRSKAHRNAAELMRLKNKRLQEQINEEIQNQASIQANRNLYRTILNGVPEMIFVHAVTEDKLPGKMIEVNEACCTALGFERSEITSRTPMDIEFVETPVSATGYSKSDMVVLSDDYVKERERKLATQSVRSRTETILQNKRLIYETALQNNRGEKIPVEVEASLLAGSKETLILCIAKDITERKRTERALKESEQTFRDFFRLSPIGIAMYDTDGNLMDVNPSCLRMFGTPDMESFSGFNMLDNPFILEKDLKKIKNRESARFEMVIDFSSALHKGLLITTRSDTAHLDVIFSHMGMDADYRSKGYFVQIQDVTDIRNAENEIKQNEQQLRQAEKMEALGSMAGGIAHDFNNILTPIIGYAQMIPLKAGDKDSSTKFSNSILNAAYRAKDLVGQILTFSRKSDDDDENYKPIHIIPIAKEVLKLQRTALPQNVEISRIIKTERDTVLANPTKIHQILMNLCTNAGHAMRATDGGTLEMRLTDFLVTGGSRRDFPDLKPGRYLNISIKDTGTGIPQDILKRIFEPFFTTKKEGEGTGMGLSVVHGIVKSLKGALKVDTSVGEGTTFHIALPVIEGAVEEEETLEPDQLPRGTEQILVVDDNPDITEMMETMLSSLGYNVSSTNFAHAALKLFEIDPSHFDLLITDHTMPATTGIELAKQFRKVRPDFPVILFSGNKNAVSEEQLAEAGIKTFLTKPIDIKDLAGKVRKELGKKG